MRRMEPSWKDCRPKKEGHKDDAIWVVARFELDDVHYCNVTSKRETILKLLCTSSPPSKQYRNIISNITTIIRKLDSAASSHEWHDEDMQVLLMSSLTRDITSLYRIISNSNQQTKALYPFPKVLFKQAHNVTNFSAL